MLHAVDQSQEADRTGAAAIDLLNAVDKYLALIDAQESEGLSLLQGLRIALAEVYVALIRLPGAGIYAADDVGGIPEQSLTDSDRAARVRLAKRLPLYLYWSALRPLTWDTVDGAGSALLITHLVELRHELRAYQEIGVQPSQVARLLQREQPTVGRAVLEPLTILQELVSDLEAYEHQRELELRGR